MIDIENFFEKDFGEDGVQSLKIDQFLTKGEQAQMRAFLRTVDDKTEHDLSQILNKCAANSRVYLTLKEQQGDILAHELGQSPKFKDVARSALSFGSSLPETGHTSALGGSAKLRDTLGKSPYNGEYKRNAPNSFERNLIFDKVGESFTDVTANKESLRQFFAGKSLEESLRIGDEYAKKTRGALPNTMRRLANFAETGLSALSSGLSPLTRGILNKSDPQQSRVYKKVEEKVNKLMDSNAAGLFRSDVKNLALLEALKSQYLGQYDQNSPAIKKVLESIESQINEIKAKNKEDDEKFQQEMDQFNTELKDITEELSEEEDSMSKFRLLQVMLLLGPLGLFAYMAPVANILGPLFSGADLGTAIAEVMTSDEFWIFADMAQAISLDVAVEFALNDLPLLGEVSAVFGEVMSIGLLQNSLSIAGPLVIGVEMVPLAGAIAFSVHRTDVEMQFAERKRAETEKLSSKIDQKYDALRSGNFTDDFKEKLKKSYSKTLEMQVKYKLEEDLIKFIIAEANKDEKDRNLNIFNDIKVKNPETGIEETLEDLFNQFNKDPKQGLDLTKTENIYPFLEKISKFGRDGVDQMLKKMLLSNDGSDLTLKDKGNNLLKNAKGDKIIEIAKETGGIVIPSIAGDFTKEKLVEHCQEELVNDHVKKIISYRNLISPTANNLYPSPSVEGATASAMGSVTKGRGVVAPAA